MKIIFNRQQLINDLSPLLCAVANKSSIASAECVLIDAKKEEGIMLTTYDLEKGVRSRVEGTVEEEGCYCISANKLFQTLRVMEGDEVTVDVNEKLETTIYSGRSSYKMKAIPAADFPNVPNLHTELSFEVPAAVLKNMISKVSFAIGVNDQRQVLNGAFFRIREGEMLVVSCDSFKLARCTCTAKIVNKNTDGSVLRYQYIVPQKTINELLRMLPDGEDDTVTIYMSRKHMVYVFDGLIFFTRLIEGEYIDFDRIIIRNHKISVIADKARLLSSLERAAIVTEEKVAGSTRTPLKFNVCGDMLQLTATSTVGSSYDEMEIEHEGDDITISFNNRYLIDAVRSCAGEKIRIELSTPLYSINIIPLNPGEGSDDLFFLLPVRTKN